MWHSKSVRVVLLSFIALAILLVVIRLGFYVALSADVPLEEHDELKFSVLETSDSQNAYELLSEAIESLTLTDEEMNKVADLLADEREWDKQLVQALIEKGRVSLELLNQATSKERIVPPELFAPESIGYDTKWSLDLFVLFNLHRLSSLSIESLIKQERWRGAVASSKEMYRLGELFHRSQLPMIYQLIGFTYKRHSVERLIEVLSRAPVELDITVSDLSLERSPQESLEALKNTVRIMNLEFGNTVKGLASKQDPESVYHQERVGFHWKPNLTRNRVSRFHLDLLDRMSLTCPFPDGNDPNPGWREYTSLIISFLFTGNSIGHSLVEIARPLESLLFRQLQGLCTYRFQLSALKILTGLRLYMRKVGQLPDSLELLEPRYLKLKNPFGDGPIHYSKTDRKLYSTFYDPDGEWWHEDLQLKVEFHSD